MCHPLHVQLSPEERAYAGRLTGFMIPVYAAVVLAIVAVAVVLSCPPRHDRMIFAGRIH